MLWKKRRKKKHKMNIIGIIASAILKVTSAAGHPWTLRTPPSSELFVRIAYGGGRFIAVGDSTSTAISNDGITWTTGSIPYSENKAITYGASKFVVMATTWWDAGVAHSSSDGITWVQSDEIDQAVAVVYGGSVFVAVLSDNFVITSPDGVAWTQQSVPSHQSWGAVAYGNGVFVAVASGGAVQIMTSPNGITWTNRTGSLSRLWTSVAYGAGLFVAVSQGSPSGVMTSPDGITWTTRTAVNAQWFSVTYGNGLFVAVGWGLNVITSTDGITWVTRSAASNAQWWGVAYGGDKFAAVGYPASGSERIMTAP